MPSHRWKYPGGDLADHISEGGNQNSGTGILRQIDDSMLNREAPGEEISVKVPSGKAINLNSMNRNRDEKPQGDF